MMLVLVVPGGGEEAKGMRCGGGPLVSASVVVLTSTCLAFVCLIMFCFVDSLQDYTSSSGLMCMHSYQRYGTRWQWDTCMLLDVSLFYVSLCPHQYVCLLFQPSECYPTLYDSVCLFQYVRFVGPLQDYTSSSGLHYPAQDPQAKAFYEQAAVAAASLSVNIDLYAAANGFIGLQTLEALPNGTGGAMYLYPSVEEATLPQDVYR